MRRVLALIVATMFLPACGLIPGSAKPTPSASPSQSNPVTALLAAHAKLQTSTLHIQYQMDSRKSALRVDADVNPTTHAIRLHTSWVEPTVELSLSGTDLYLKWPGLSVKPWLRVKPADLPPSGRLRQLMAVFAPARVLAGVMTATEVAPGTYIGTFNFDNAIAAATDDVERTTLTGFADRADERAAKVEFRASLDKQGRLSELHYILGTPGSPYFMAVDVSVLNYDEPFVIDVPPAASLEEAKPALYAKL